MNINIQCRRILFALLAIGLVFGFMAFRSHQSEEESIKKVAHDYIEGAFSANSDRFISALHPEVNKVKPTVIQGTKKEYLRKSGYSMLEEVVRARGAYLPESQRKIKVDILDHHKSIASVKISSTLFIDYCQMVKINGAWKIVNVLWVESNPQ